MINCIDARFIKKKKKGYTCDERDFEKISYAEDKNKYVQESNINK